MNKEGVSVETSSGISMSLSALVEMCYPQEKSGYFWLRTVTDMLLAMDETPGWVLPLATFAGTILTGIPVFPAKKMEGLAVKESNAMLLALQRGGHDLAPALKRVLPEFIENLPEGKKAKSVVREILLGRDVDVVKDLEPRLAAAFLARKLPQMPGIMPRLMYKDKQRYRFMLMGERVQLSSQLERLLGVASEDLVQMVEISHGAYPFGDDSYVQLMYGAVRVPRQYGGMQVIRARDEIVYPQIVVQVTPIEAMKSLKPNPYRWLSWDRVMAPFGTKMMPPVAWMPVETMPGEKPKRWIDGMGPMSLSNAWWPGRYQAWNGSRRSIMPSAVQMSKPEEDHWFGLDARGLGVLTEPMVGKGFEALRSGGKVILVGRTIFKAVEGELLLARTPGGRERLMAGETNQTPAVADELQLEIRDFCKGWKEYISGSNRQSMRKGISRDGRYGMLEDEMKAVSKQFAKNMLVAAGMNPGRFWRYFVGLQVFMLSPALRDIPEPRLKRLEGEFQIEPGLAAELLTEGRYGAEWCLNGYNHGELAYDKMLADYTYRGEVPVLVQKHFEFGWKWLARLLRKVVEPGLAEIEDDMEFLVRVFDLAPELDWA